MKVPTNPPNPNTPSADVATQQWVSTYYATKTARTSTYRKTSSKQVVNTVSATDLLNGEIVLGANVLGANGVLRLTAWGDSVNNSGATQGAPRFQLSLGGTVLLDTSSASPVWLTNASRWGWRCVCEIANLSTSGQWTSIDLRMSGSFQAGNAAFSTGEGLQCVFVNSLSAIGGGSSSIDTAVAKALALSVILPAASASIDVTLKSALVEII